MLRHALSGLLFVIGLLAEEGLARAAGDPQSPYPQLGEASPLTYDAPAHPGQPNRLTLRLNGPDIELLDDASGVILRSRPLAATSAVLINGAAGEVDDTLTVDFSGGLITVRDGINYDGGAGGFDSLVLHTGQAPQTTHTPTGAMSGALDVGGVQLAYANLEPVTVTGDGSNAFIFTSTDAADTITLENGATPGFLRWSSTGQETVDFSNFGTVTINAGVSAADVGDTITIDFTRNATALTNLIVNAGAGDDIIVVTAATGATLTVNGGTGNDAIVLGSLTPPSTLAGILSPVVVNGEDHNLLSTVSLTCVGVTKTLPLGDRLIANDSGNGTASNYSLSSTTFQRTGTGLVTYSTIERVDVLAGTGNDTVDVASTIASGTTIVSPGTGSDMVTLTEIGANFHHLC